ncbi:RQC domain-containing protein [Halobaculum rarum]|uniref:RQC domain-containing protein n=1 Tax=Halobaculum rarum TaxID=3075122 RepID=UPI0032AF418D
MNEVDDAILEFFAAQDQGLALPPAPVWYNLTQTYGVLDKSKETVARRMRKLPERGLLEKIDEKRGYYKITEKGRAYLAGEITSSDLKTDEE